MSFVVFPPPEAITPSDSLPEAGRKALWGYFREMVEAEPAAHAGDDIEGVHKMRVATRRLRSVYRSLGDYLPPSYQGKLARMLRRTARILGDVRDLDVFMERTQGYIQEQLAADPEPLADLLRHLNTEHTVARANLLTWLDAPAFHDFLAAYVAVLTPPATTEHLRQRRRGVPLRYLVGEQLPILLYERYNAVWGYAAVLPSDDFALLHSLRIEVKRLRYLVDSFADVLTAEAGAVLTAQTKLLQGHLGDLNDAVGAARRLEALPTDADTRAYAELCHAQAAALHAGFPPLWDDFLAQTRPALPLALGAL